MEFSERLRQLRENTVIHKNNLLIFSLIAK